MTVTPVLADQLEDAGAKERCGRFSSSAIGAADLDAAEVDPEHVPAAKAEGERWRRALELLNAVDGDPLRAFADAREEGRVALATSAATHAVLPLLATRQGVQLSSRRASGPTNAVSAGTGACGCRSAPTRPA